MGDDLNGRIVIILVLELLLVGKVLATLLACGSGGSGGLFAPTLFIGVDARGTAWAFSTTNFSI